MLAELAGGSLAAALALFAAATAVIALAGTRIAGVADRLADRTRLGEAAVGATLLGASTSLSGAAMSMAAALDGYPELAVSNAIGGIGVQTLFLAVADLAYRRANLEHAAASVPNLVFGVALIAMLSLTLLAVTGPAWTLAHVHPASPLLLAAYIMGLRLAREARSAPMWRPRDTGETQVDRPDEAQVRRDTLAGLLLHFAVLALLLGGAGLVMAESAGALAELTGIGELALGSLLTATATSLPELVTTLAAVRRGALTLAVGGIIGGNTFDVLFLVIADAAYLEGSIYHAGGARFAGLLSLVILLTAVLLLGMLRRERHGLANVGLEGVLIFALYLGGMATLLLGG